MRRSFFQEMAAGGRFQKLEEQEKELSKEVARLKTKHDLRVNSVNEAEAAVVSLQNTVAEVSCTGFTPPVCLCMR